MNTTPEHLHLALNHLPFLGAAFALIPLGLAFLTNNKTAALAGLICAVIAGWATPFVMATGEAAYERYEEGPIAQFLDPQAETSLEEHEHRAEAWSKVMYVSAVVATISLALLLWKPAWVRAVTVPAAVLCAASLLSGIWIAESGGPIRRPDFRGAQAGAASAPELPKLKAKKKQKDHDEEKEHDTD